MNQLILHSQCVRRMNDDIFTLFNQRRVFVGVVRAPSVGMITANNDGEPLLRVVLQLLPLHLEQV